jgi:hypothetical protein
LILPTFETAERKPEVRYLVGDTKSDKPIRPGGISKDEAFALLGKPLVTEQNGAVFKYLRIMSSGVSVWLPFRPRDSAPLEERGYALRLEFGTDGVLKEYELIRIEGPYWQSTHFGWERMSDQNYWLLESMWKLPTEEVSHARSDSENSIAAKATHQ